MEAEQAIQQKQDQLKAWDANYLYFTVREPFPSKTSSASLVFGTITKEEPLVLEAQMAENGVILAME
jgi:hypothetical protein